jgi:hypothetical protein
LAQHLIFGWSSILIFYGYISTSQKETVLATDFKSSIPAWWWSVTSTNYLLRKCQDLNSYGKSIQWTSLEATKHH